MKKEITVTRTINAPREKVWEAWTDPAIVSQWWGPNGVTTPVCEIDLRVGGKIHMVMLAGESLGEMAGQEWPLSGEFTEVVPLEKLVFTNSPTDADGNPLMRGMTTATFEDAGEGTNLTIVTGAEGDGPGVEQMLGGMEQGWNEQTDKLAALVQ